MVEYKNQSVAELRGKVTDEFERLDKYGYRDDQEIYEAGKRVIGNILKKIKEQHKSWGKSALKELNDLSMEYEKNIKKMK